MIEMLFHCTVFCRELSFDGETACHELGPLLAPTATAARLPERTRGRVPGARRRQSLGVWASASASAPEPYREQTKPLEDRRRAAGAEAVKRRERLPRL